MPSPLLERALRHQVQQQRLGSSVANEIVRMLKLADRDLVRQLEGRLGELSGPFTTARLAAVLDEVRSAITRVYASIASVSSDRLRDFALYETQFQTALLGAAVNVSVVTPPASLVTAAVTSRPMRGRLLSEWVEELGAADYRRVRDSIRLGVIEGQTVPQIGRRVRDALGVGQRSAEAFARTAVNQIGTEARDAVFGANSDVLAGETWSATLDDRTCPTCAPLDGKTFRIGKGPRPPAHIGCRCVMVPELKEDFDVLPRSGGERASESGPVPATQTYQTWLKSQSAEFQDDVLGPSRGALFRRGGLTVDKFVGRSGDQLTLDELRKREPAAFSRANV